MGSNGRKKLHTRACHICGAGPRSPAERGCRRARARGNPGAISSARAPPTPDQTRVPYLPRVSRGSIRIAGALCYTRARGVHLNREFHICHACPAASIGIAGALCSACAPRRPSESRVPYLPRVPRGAYLSLRPFRIASSISSAQRPQGPAEKRVDFIETLQKCEFHIFHAGPAGSIRKTGGFY